MKTHEKSPVEEANVSWLSANWKPIKDADLRPGESVVYLGVFDGAVKIGISIKPVDRLRALSNSSGRGLNSAYVLVCEQRYDARRAEAALHERFARHRVEGEWFKLNPSEVLAGDVLVRQLPPTEEGASEGLTNKQAEIAYDLFMVATPRQVYDAQVNAVKRAFAPIMGEVLARIVVAVDRAGRPFVIEPGLTGAQAVHVLCDLIEDGGGLDQFQGLENVITQIAEQASFGSKDEFCSVREGRSEEKGGAA